MDQSCRIAEPETDDIYATRGEGGGMTQIERLVKIYTDSRARLLKEIEKRILWGRSTYAQERLLKEIDKELKRLNLESYAWADDAVNAAYMRAARATYLAAHSFDKGIKAFSAFGGLHRKAMAVLAHNAQEYLAITNSLIARQAADRVREIGVELITRKFGENLTVQETKRALMERFQQEDFYAVPWRNGKGAMRVDSYSALVARTTTREATMTATYNQAEALGHHLYKITSHATTCAVCASRQGRVYRSIDYPAGDVRNQFPHISEGFPRWPTYKTVHPNCAHVAVMYIWDQKSPEEQQAALARANEPFNHDPRGEAERRRYEEAQRKNAERLRDRKQWERYREVLGKENVPKTLSGFRAMKKSGNENWQRLQWDYRFQNAHGVDAKNPPLPNHESAYGVWGKLKRYSLNYSHPVGKHKTVVFESALGYNQDSAEILEKRIKEALPKYRATYTGNKGYGDTFRVTLLIEGIGKKTGIFQPVETGWEFSNLDREKPRMVNCIVSTSKRP